MKDIFFAALFAAGVTLVFTGGLVFELKIMILAPVVDAAGRPRDVALGLGVGLARGGRRHVLPRQAAKIELADRRRRKPVVPAGGRPVA